jgi:hypothetical protein
MSTSSLFLDNGSGKSVSKSRSYTHLTKHHLVKAYKMADLMQEMTIFLNSTLILNSTSPPPHTSHSSFCNHSILTPVYFYRVHFILQLQDKELKILCAEYGIEDAHIAGAARLRTLLKLSDAMVDRK